jgi:REP element-mobilizing transposase RayT
MKDYKAKLVPGGVYHVYNRAIGDELLFRNSDNYEYFIKKYKEYIDSVANTFAYCLMPNHFHLLIQIKPEAEIFSNFDQKVLQKWLFNTSLTVYERYMNRKINLQFAHLFNSYAQAYNKMHERKGSLFIRSYNRKRIESDTYLRQLALYIHLNPVKDGQAKAAEDWPYCSYNELINQASQLIDTSFVIDLFESVENFDGILKQTLQGL